MSDVRLKVGGAYYIVVYLLCLS